MIKAVQLQRENYIDPSCWEKLFEFLRGLPQPQIRKNFHTHTGITTESGVITTRDKLVVWRDVIYWQVDKSGAVQSTCYTL